MKAIELQKILGVEDNQIILYGYTYNRSTVEIYFESGKLIRVTKDLDVIEKVIASEDVTCNLLFSEIKRFYSNGTNPKFRNLSEIFRDFGLCETKGGKVSYGTYCKYPLGEEESSEEDWGIPPGAKLC